MRTNPVILNLSLYLNKRNQYIDVFFKPVLVGMCLFSEGLQGILIHTLSDFRPIFRSKNVRGCWDKLHQGWKFLNSIRIMHWNNIQPRFSTRFRFVLEIFWNVHFTAEKQVITVTICTVIIFSKQDIIDTVTPYQNEVNLMPVFRTVMSPRNFMLRSGLEK